MTKDKLTTKEQIFCNEFISNGGNGTKAVISAGYAPSSAHIQQNRLRARDKITAEIERQLEAETKRTSLTRDTIINEQFQLYQLAKADSEYKTASAILGEVSKLLGYAPQLNTTKEVNMKVQFERLLRDVTPEKKVISDSYPKGLIN